ncbi:hypothetical protein SRABI36_02532 [Pedobacter sp. Bi36]|uniref:hypothetical protein n=1 Tax=Pedobacter sp. Bi126 TaxID=2822349 RepID=UPI001E012A33|nr:hypothetical protein [Pedobacter sp. Bi126]CAH0135260.1 hypothetical protein SRABI126_00150 [Pedobacter sp. Bi126]CAH0223120.1 hypothetical protein SRABI36_02532 [Pedobacter sp. Bi36]
MTLSDYNSRNLSLKTTQQVLESFYEHYNVDKIKLTLLESFQGYALNEKKGFLELKISEQEVSDVFDSLIDLVTAVRTLMEQGKIEGVRA